MNCSYGAGAHYIRAFLIAHVDSLAGCCTAAYKSGNGQQAGGYQGETFCVHCFSFRNYLFDEIFYGLDKARSIPVRFLLLFLIQKTPPKWHRNFIPGLDHPY